MKAVSKKNPDRRHSDYSDRRRFLVLYPRRCTGQLYDSGCAARHTRKESDGHRQAGCTAESGCRCPSQRAVADPECQRGDFVKKGDLLAVIDPVKAQNVVIEAEQTVSEIKARLKQAEAEYALHRQPISGGWHWQKLRLSQSRMWMRRGAIWMCSARRLTPIKPGGTQSGHTRYRPQ